MILKAKVTKCRKWKVIGMKGKNSIDNRKQTRWNDLIIIMFIFFNNLLTAGLDKL